MMEEVNLDKNANEKKSKRRKQDLNFGDFICSKNAITKTTKKIQVEPSNVSLS